MKKYKTNFQRVVQSLMEVGLSQRQIARETGVTQPTISHIYQRVWSHREPKYETGAAILALAEKHGIRPDGSKDSKMHPRGSWKAMPPPPSHNKVLVEREAQGRA